ncbi:MAG: hypothetical protein ABR865_05575 [Terracidiphilus sp.]|jgi:hypothetical protein
MARAKSVDGLKAWKKTSGDGYRANVVFAFRLFELEQTAPVASALFGVLPQDEDLDSVWHSFGTYLCKEETDSDIHTLADLEGRMPRELAMAVLLSPDKMFRYISYAELSLMYPDSDYAEQMEGVCRLKHAEFVDAVNQLPATREKWFVARIFNPDGCHALAHPESDQ